MAFQQGLSGLASSSRALDVISNNVANASTVGFKSGQTLFADMYASALSGAASGIQVGIGSMVNGVRQAFNQGNLSVSNNPLDLAINGNGFFRMARLDGSIAYTRNGQFDVNKDGYIVNAYGDRLMGFGVAAQNGNAATVFEGNPSALRIDTANIDPFATTQVEMTANLDARAVNPTTLTPAGPVFNPAAVPPDPESYNFTTSVQVFDTLGNPHTLSYYFVRTNPAVNRTWDVYISQDGAATGGAAGQLAFDEYGVIDPASALINYNLALTNGALTPQTVEIDFSNTSQFGDDSAVTDLFQDGYTTGQLTGLVVTKDGIVQGRYSNGQSKDIGKVALSNFRAPNGLVSLGNNLWAESPESGPEVIGAPGTGVLGVVSSGMVEESNVDLTQELVQMIVMQRNYQANAQSIKTQDQILQTLVNLR